MDMDTETIIIPKEDYDDLIELLIDSWRTLHANTIAPAEDIYFTLERLGQLPDEMREALEYIG